MLDYSKLRGRIVEKYGSIRAFAEAADMSRAQISHKLNGRTDFYTRDIIKWSKLLEIAPEDIHIYFFSETLYF